MNNKPEQIDVSSAVTFSERELPIIWNMCEQNEEFKKEVGLLIQRTWRKAKGLPEIGINEDQVKPEPLPLK